MTFNYGLEKKKFDKAWAALRKHYLECGMEPEAVEEMYQFDWDTFKATRVEALHTQDMAIPNNVTDEDDLDSQLLKKFADAFTSDYDTYGSHSRYWWLEELNNPCLVIGLGKLSEEDKELLTLLIVEQMTVREISVHLSVAKSTISDQLQRIFSFFREMP